MNKSLDWDKRRSRIRLLLHLNLVLLLILGCSLPQEPGDWSWNTHLYVPLGSRTYALWQLVTAADTTQTHGSRIGMNADSSMFFLGYQRMNVSFRDSFYIDSSYYEAIKPVVAIEAPVDLNQTDVFSLGTLNPGVAAQHGNVVNLPPHSLSARTSISMGSRVDSMVVDTGSILLTISNGLPYVVSALEIQLDNQATIYPLISNESITGGGQIVRRASLSLMELRNLDQLDLSATGDGGDSILVDSTQGLTMTAVMDTVLSAPYYGIIPRQVLSADSLVDIFRPQRLYEGLIDTGSVTITAINESQLDDTITVIFPSITTLAGDSLVSRQFVPANSQRSETTNLRNHLMRLTDAHPQQVAVRVRAVSNETPDRQAFENVGQFVRGTVRSTRIGFSTFRGELNNLEVPIAPSGTAVARPPTGWDALHCTTVDATVRTRGNVNATASTFQSVQSFLGGNLIARDSLTATGVQLHGDTVEFHNLANLMNQYPDSISTSGAMLISGPVTMSENDVVTLDVDLVAPLEFVLDPVNAPSDVQLVDTPGMEEIEGGSAHVQIWNRLPVGGRVFLVASRDSSSLLPDTLGVHVDTLANVTIPHSTIVNRRATGEAAAEVAVVLDSAALDLFQHPPFYTRLQIDLPGSNGDTLIALASDYVRVQIVADLLYRVQTQGGH